LKKQYNMENQTIAFIPELTKQVEIGNKTMTRRLTGLEKVNISPDDFRFDGVDEKDANIYYFEELKVGEPTESYIIVRSKYRVGEIINVESTDKKIQITDVRAERLKNISEEDAISEGIDKKGDLYFNYVESEELEKFFPKEYFYKENTKVSFMSLWSKINGIDSWIANPWVWVYEFKIL